MERLRRHANLDTSRPLSTPGTPTWITPAAVTAPCTAPIAIHLSFKVETDLHISAYGPSRADRHRFAHRLDTVRLQCPARPRLDANRYTPAQSLGRPRRASLLTWPFFETEVRMLGSIAPPIPSQRLTHLAVVYLKGIDRRPLFIQERPSACAPFVLRLPQSNEHRHIRSLSSGGTKKGPSGGLTACDSGLNT